MVLWVVLCSSLITVHCPLLLGQQPQAQSGQPVYAVNAKYVNGVAPGYWPTAGSGLTLNLSAGTAYCSNAPVIYAGGTLTMTASATNYVYLDSSASCSVAANTSGFLSTSIPIAKVTTGASSITSVLDVRTFFVPPPSGSGSTIVYAGAPSGGDDSSTIQALLNGLPATGGTIIFQNGHYATCNLTHTGKGLELLGAGPAGGGPGTDATTNAATYLTCTTTGAKVLTLGTQETYTYNGARITNIQFEGGSTSAGGLEIANNSYNLLDHVGFKGFSKAGLAAPSAPTLALAAGAGLSTGTYYVAVSYVNPSGETLASSTSNIAVTDGGCPASGNCRITVTSPSASGDATAYEVYEGASASALHLNNPGTSTGPTNLGTNYTISSTNTTASGPLIFDQSAGFGVKFYGTYANHGHQTAFVNQPSMRDLQIWNGTRNGIIATRRVSGIVVEAGNANMNGVTSGCALQEGGIARTSLHYEADSSWTGKFHCATGLASEIHDLMEASGSPTGTGLYAINMDKASVMASCSGLSNAVSLDSASTRNMVIMRSNGTCGVPMIADADTSKSNTKFEDSTTPYYSFGVAVNGPLNIVSFSATPTFDAALGNTQKITLTGNVTSSTLSNARTGEWLNFLICQDGSGSHTFAWPANIKGGMTVGSTLSTCSAQTFVFDGTNAYALGAGATNQ